MVLGIFSPIISSKLSYVVNISNYSIVLNTYRAALSAEVPPGEVPLPMSPSNQTGSSALDEAMAKTLAAIDPNLANSIPIPEESK